MLIKVAEVEAQISASIKEIEQGFFATPPATLEDMRDRIGQRNGLTKALDIIAAIVKEKDDEE